MSLVTTLSGSRHEFWEISHSPNKNLEEKLTGWLCHKAYSVISLPVNAAEILVCVAGFGVSACTIGAAKIAIYAITLGNFELPVTVGFEFFATHTFEGICGLGSNIWELVYDAGNLIYNFVQLPKIIAKQLGLDGFLEKILLEISKIAMSCFKNIGKVFEFCFKRVEAGLNKACASEKAIISGTPFPLHYINDLTTFERIDTSSQERSFATIFKHYVYSIANIPCNAAATVVLGGVSVLATGPLFLFKAALYATTNIEIPLPTYAGQTIVSTGAVLRNVIADAATDVGDIAVTLYKVSDAIGAIKVMTTALGVLQYIPRAIFG